jgi:hypothetical protein
MWVQYKVKNTVHESIYTRLAWSTSHSDTNMDNLTNLLTSNYSVRFAAQLPLRRRWSIGPDNSVEEGQYKGRNTA